MAKYWFKPKRFGWGVTPISLEGWIITLAFTILLVSNSLAIFNTYPMPEALYKFVFDTSIGSLVFLLLIKRRTKGDLGI